jgi:membrane protease YdiL (CAAX protease family)
VIFVALGLATFLLGANTYRLFPTNGSALYEGGLAALCLAAALGLRRSRRFQSLWPVAYAFFVANMVWWLSTLAGGFGNWVLRRLALAADTPQGMAVAKLGESLAVVAIILALCLPAGFSLSSLYLQRGRLKWALLIGIVVILNFTTAALMATAGQPRAPEALGQVILWGLVFSAANGFMEELWIRGLLLGRLAPHLGPGGAVLVTAVVFALMHAGAVYYDPATVTVFVVNTFTHALVLGYLILKTDTLWGAALYHMAMDLWLFIATLTLGMR